jgi:DNA-binding CsgD family transcriptional regulator
LYAELNFKKKELTSHALQLAKKNEMLEGLKQKAMALKKNSSEKKNVQQLINTINFDLKHDHGWEHFYSYFEEVHTDFNKNILLQYPNITSNELRLMVLLKMNLNSKEIADILNISAEGVKKARQRLRKKMNLSADESLEALILSL